MSISDIKPGENVKNVHFTEDTLSVDLTDGRTITVPLAWYAYSGDTLLNSVIK